MSQFVRDALRITQIGNYEPGHVRQRRNRFGDVPVGRLLEIEKDRQVIPLAEFVTDRIENGLALGSDPAKDQDDLGRDGVNETSNVFFMEEQV